MTVLETANGATITISYFDQMAHLQDIPILESGWANARNPVGRRAADAGHRPGLPARPACSCDDHQGLAPLIVKQIFSVIRN
jgi:hypothetical protein